MSTFFSDGNSWNTSPSYWSTIQYADVNADGKADVCGRASDGVWCALYRPLYRDFGAPVRFTTQFDDADGWNQPQYYSTIRLADINGDGAADICGRGSGGVICGLSTGSAFVGTDRVPAPAFSDVNGWNAPQYYQTMTLTDVDGDGRADVCGRGGAGIWCALSQSNLVAPAFAPAQLWVKNFGDNYGWGAGPAYYGTIKPARVSRAYPQGHAFCGRGASGIVCSRR